MLIPNEKKGWFGSFSEIGRRAARLHFLISKEPPTKKFNNKESLVISAFEASENKNKDIFKKNNDDGFDIFTIDDTDKLKLEELTKSPISNPLSFQKNKKDKNKINKLNQSNKKFYYYHLHKKTKEKIGIQSNPPCTKYNPKYTSIFPRSASSPPWMTMKARTKLFDNKVDEHPFYIEHENILDTMAGKGFIDMKKQKQNEEEKKDNKNLSRFKINKSATVSPNFNLKNKSKNFNTNKKERRRPYSTINARLRRQNYSENLKDKLISALSEYKECRKNKSMSNFQQKKIMNKKVTSLSRNKTIEIDFNKSSATKLNNSSLERNKSDIRNENSKESLDISQDSYDLYKNIYTKGIKRKHNINYNRTYSKEIIKGPNFKQMISRETLDKLRDDKIPIVPYLLPNFSSVRDRNIMMVVYDRKYHKINRNKSDSLARIDNTFYYDPNEILTKINNYVSSHPPNFNMMTSRPDDDDPLPSYMKRIYTRNSCYAITQLSLKLNNYKNRGFAKNNSSFFPKKSFNKIVNLNLLKSKKFLGNVIGNENLFYRQFRGIGTSLKFYNKNYEDILRDNFLERFDNVTFKTIKQNHSKKISELVVKVKEEAEE
jgi:hypothetical protein